MIITSIVDEKSILDEKVNVEMTVAELAYIGVMLGRNNYTDIRNAIRESKSLNKVYRPELNDKVDNHDVTTTYYTISKYLEEIGVFKY